MIWDYDLLARKLTDPRVVFLNYGFADPSRDDYDWIRAEDREDKHHLSLVREVLDGARLDGRTIVEVGCGRGGNCSYLARYARPERILGVDACVGGIRFCAAVHREPRLAFIAAAAEALPFPDGSVDLVLNLESSHCYERFDRFLAEVRRVLKPGGLFRFADIWGWDLLPIDWSRREEDLRSTGLVIESDHDISRGVTEALESGDGLGPRLRALAGPGDRDLAESVARGADGMRDLLTLGACRYRALRLRKPETRLS